MRKFGKTCHKPDYSYIEARFQDQVARTTVAVGPNPAWNQELALTFKSLNNDYSPETLNRVKVKKILEDSLDSIPSPLPSVKIQIIGGKGVKAKHCWMLSTHF